MQFSTDLDKKQEKAQLRIAVRKQLDKMTTTEMKQSDEAMFGRFLALEQVQAAKTCLLFLGITGLEPDTGLLARRLFDQGKVICMPRTIADHGMEVRVYQPGDPYDVTSYGVMEPALSCPLVDKRHIDLVLVPAMCYDRQGFRLGFGGGYYDRWLAGYHGQTIGLCRERLLSDGLPVEAHDKPVSILVTEERVVLCHNAKKQGQ